MALPPERGRLDRASDDAETRLGWRMAGLAFTTATEAVAGVLIGVGIDYLAGTRPRWTLIGGIAGIAVGLLSFIKGAIALNRLLTAKENERRARGIPPPPPLPDEPESEEDEAAIEAWRKQEKD
jgi:F0F1-type ATP synthase assembly protein I